MDPVWHREKKRSKPTERSQLVSSPSCAFTVTPSQKGNMEMSKDLGSAWRMMKRGGNWRLEKKHPYLCTLHLWSFKGFFAEMSGLSYSTQGFFGQWRIHFVDFMATCPTAFDTTAAFLHTWSLGGRFIGSRNSDCVGNQWWFLMYQYVLGLENCPLCKTSRIQHGTPESQWSNCQKSILTLLCHFEHQSALFWGKSCHHSCASVSIQEKQNILRLALKNEALWRQVQKLPALLPI